MGVLAVTCVGAVVNAGSFAVRGHNHRQQHTQTVNDDSRFPMVMEIGDGEELPEESAGTLATLGNGPGPIRLMYQLNLKNDDGDGPAIEWPTIPSLPSSGVIFQGGRDLGGRNTNSGKQSAAPTSEPQPEPHPSDKPSDDPPPEPPSPPSIPQIPIQFGFSSLAAVVTPDPTPDPTPPVLDPVPPVIVVSSPPPPSPPPPPGPVVKPVTFASAGAPAVTAVPEPGIWMLLIFGFGAVGQALRSKRRAMRAMLDNSTRPLGS